MSRSPADPSGPGHLSPQFALLGLLLAGPQHGYDLHRQFGAELGHVWHLSQSQAYAILKRLEARGAISAHAVAQQKRPPRQMFRITALGRRRFRQWLEQRTSRNARAIRLEFLTRLYFIQRFSPEKADAIYEAQRAQVKSSITRLQRLIDDVPGGQVINRLSLDLRLRQMKLILSWLEEIKHRRLLPDAER